MIEALVNALRDAGCDLDAVDLADALWLAQFLPGAETRRVPTPVPAPSLQEPVLAETPETEASVRRAPAAAAPGPPRRPTASLYPAAFQAEGSAAGAVLVRLPSASALPGQLGLARALRPLKQRRRSKKLRVLDEELTAEAFAESRLLLPILRPDRERWFEVALIVDDSPSMAVWEQTAAEFGRLLKHHGAFRDVRLWHLSATDAVISLQSESGLRHAPHELVDPLARRLTIVLTDCIDPLWYRSAIWESLAQWGRFAPVVLAQVMPPRLWPQTGLGAADVTIRSARPGLPNQSLSIDLPWWWANESRVGQGPALPVVTLEAGSITRWARMLMGAGGASALGTITRPPDETSQRAGPTPALSAPQRVEAFRVTVSPMAYQLAVFLSAVPLRLPVMRIVQQAMLPESHQAHLAECLVGGLIRRMGSVDARISPDEVEYDFVDGVRAILQRALTRTGALSVLSAVARFLAKRLGQSPGFSALLSGGPPQKSIPPEVLPFANVGAELLTTLGIVSPSPTPEAALGTAVEGEPVVAGIESAAVEWSAAIVIGVEGYEAWPELKGAVEAAKRVTAWLADPAGGQMPPERVTTLLEPGDPGEFYKTLLTTIDRASEQGDTAGLLLIFAAGRFATISNDTVLLLGTSTREWSRAIPMGALRSWIVKRGIFREVMLVLAGPAQPVRFSSTALTLTNPSQARQISQYSTLWASLTAEQDLNRFVDALLQGLGGAAATTSGEITPHSLVTFVQQRLRVEPGYAGLQMEHESSGPFALRAGLAPPRGRLELRTEGGVSRDVVVWDGSLRSIWTGPVDDRVKLELPTGLYRVEYDGESQVVEVTAGQAIEIALSVESEPVPITRRFALLLGIDHYALLPDKDSDSTAVAEARAVARQLEALGYDTVLVTDEKATRRGMDGALDRMLTKVREGDLVWLHVCVRVLLGGDADATPVVALFDSDPEHPFATGWPVNDVVRRMTSSGATAMLATLEHRDLKTLAGERVEPYKVSFTDPNRSFAMLRSTTLGGKWEDHGPLTYLILRALRGESDAQPAETTMGGFVSEVQGRWHRWAANNDYDSDNLHVDTAGPLTSILIPESAASRSSTEDLEVLGRGSVLICGHGGELRFSSQHGLLTESDLLKAAIVGCPNAGLATKPCSRVVSIEGGLAEELASDGSRLVLKTVRGLTDGTPPGAVSFRVRTAQTAFQAKSAGTAHDSAPERQGEEQEPATKERNGGATRIKPNLIYWSDIIENQGSPHDVLAQYDRLILAEGDSWFSLGERSPTPLLESMIFSKPTLIVICGETAASTMDIVGAENNSLLREALAHEGRPWDLLLLSTGLDDLLNGVGKILIPSEQRSPGANTPADYCNQARLRDLIDQIQNRFRRLASFRDAPTSNAKRVTIVTHTYDYPTPRNVIEPANEFTGFTTRPRLYTAMKGANVPERDWVSVASYLIDVLAEGIRSLANGSDPINDFHVLDTRGTLKVASVKTPGPSGDWQNELQPKETGLKKLARRLEKSLDALIS